jgi:hypothetical protein
VLVGLGHSQVKAVDVDVLWPSGTRQKLSNLQLNRYLKIVEGTQ